jgi:predicted peptidase
MIRCAIILSFLFFLLSCKKDPIDPSSPDFVETEFQTMVAVHDSVNEAIGGFYASVPVHYDVSSKKYPLLICFHGSGQFGNGKDELSKLDIHGIPELLKERIFPPNFKVNGKNYAFIILMPQFKRYPFYPELESYINYAKQHYRIDSTRIYLTGLSMGGTISCEMAADYPSLFAAIVPMAGATGHMDKCEKLAEGNVPIWLFHNNNDNFVPLATAINFIDAVNSFQPSIPPKFTTFPAFGLYGHDAWSKASDPRFKENNMNIYEWMLQYSR